MIDEEKTFKIFGYYSTDWAEQSHKKVVAICEECGKVRIVLKYSYRDLCASCCRLKKNLSDETRAKISASLTGKNNPMFGKIHSKEVRTKMGASLTDKNNHFYGKKHSKKAKMKMSISTSGENNPMFGKHHTKETLMKMRGENNPNWNPNLTDEEREIKRNTLEYNTWVRAVKETNNFTCVKCNTCEGELISHHLFAYWKYPEARFIIGNGVTLCKSCYNKFHRLYGYKYFTIDDFFIFCRDY